MKIIEGQKIYLGPDSNRVPTFHEWLAVNYSVNEPLMKRGDPGSNPGRDRFFLVLQLFFRKNHEIFYLKEKFISV